MARAVPLVINFMARWLKLGGIGETIKGVIKKVQAPIGKGIDKVVKWVVTKAGALFGKGKSASDSDTVGKTSPEHDRKVAAGLADIDKEEKRYVKNGRISREDAEKISLDVKKRNPVFKSISVVEGTKTWDFSYIASPENTKKGKKKKEESDLEKLWDEIQEILNKNADRSLQLPKEYEYHTRENIKFIRRKKSYATDKYPVLDIDNKNRIVLGKNRSKRISKPGLLAKNLGGGKDGYEAHHLIPDAVVKRHPLTVEAIKRGNPKYNLDDASNGIMLPKNEDAQKENPHLPIRIHNGSHSNWNKNATLRLNSRIEVLKRVFKGFKKSSDSSLTRSVKSVEKQLRKNILTWKEIK